MRIAAIALAAVALPGLLAPVAAAAPADTPPPYIDHVTWAKWGDLSSLRVYPTPAARRASGHAGTQPLAQAAWNEVLTLSPDAAIPGMWEQFLCHWNLAEFAQPGKASWNLEPWRPEVSYEEMVAKRCNPGGTEEPF